MQTLGEGCCDQAAVGVRPDRGLEQKGGTPRVRREQKPPERGRRRATAATTTAMKLLLLLLLVVVVPNETIDD